MTVEPTYAELVQRIQDLESEAERLRKKIAGLQENSVHNGVHTCRYDNAREAKRSSPSKAVPVLDDEWGEFRTRTRNGETRNTIWSNIPLKDGSSIGIDITDRKKATAALLESEQKFRFIFDSINDGVFIHDMEANILEVNQAGCKRLGYHRHELVEMKIPDVDADEFSGMIMDRILTLDQKNQMVFESAHRTKHGVEFPVEINSRKIEFQGKPCILSVARDITERKKTEVRIQNMKEELLQRNQFISTILENLPIGLAVHSIDEDKATYMNTKFEEIYGWPKEEINTLKKFFDHVYPDPNHRARVRNRVLQDLKSGDPARMVWEGFEVTGKNGTKKMVDAKNIPILDQRLIITTVQDVTERNQLQAQLQQAQKMEAVGSLAGGIAHDFNNILFPIIGLSEMLMYDLPPGSPEFENAEEILKAGKRGGELVQQILSFSRRTEHKRMPIRIQQILKEVIKLARSTIPADIIIEADIHSDCGPVMADPIQIHQVAMNLITNAYHALESAAGKISIQLQAVHIDEGEPAASPVEPGRYARLVISDTGCGIDPAVMGKIFEPYFTTKSQGKGTGLGLAVVYGIIKKHGGHITVESELKNGTTFKVFLPLIEKTAGLTPIRPIEDYPGNHERILIVDDEAVIIRVQTRILERLGYQVFSRMSSVDALEAFRSNPTAFDLVITDMNMPDVTGDRLAEEMISIRPDLPVILCTGFSERIDPEQAKAMGIRGFLMKPVIKADMAKMIRTVLDEAGGLKSPR